ncbi:MAG: hypothetical protein ACP5N1_01255 [Candidatus Woesearchaeota archaeon]
MRKVNSRTQLDFGELENLLESKGFERIMELKYVDRITRDFLRINPTWEIYVKDYNGFYETAFISDYNELAIQRDYSKQTRSSPQSKLTNHLEAYYEYVASSQFHIDYLVPAAGTGGVVGFFAGLAVLSLDAISSLWWLVLPPVIASVGIAAIVKGIHNGENYLAASKNYARNRIIAGSDALNYLSGNSGKYFKPKY